MSQKLIITVGPAPNHPGKFEAYLGDRQLVSHSYMPLLGSARVLLAEGYDPGAPLVMRHSRSTTDCLTTTVGYAARLTVEEGAFGPMFRRYRNQQQTPVETRYRGFTDPDGIKYPPASLPAITQTSTHFAN